MFFNATLIAVECMHGEGSGGGVGQSVRKGLLQPVGELGNSRQCVNDINRIVKHFVVYLIETL